MKLRAHRLKAWPEYHAALRARVKTFELRRNDRDFRVGDMLEIEEWDRETSTFTLIRPVICEVAYILDVGQFLKRCDGVDSVTDPTGGLVVLGLSFPEVDEALTRRMAYVEPPPDPQLPIKIDVDGRSRDRDRHALDVLVGHTQGAAMRICSDVSLADVGHPHEGSLRGRLSGWTRVVVLVSSEDVRRVFVLEPGSGGVAELRHGPFAIRGCFTCVLKTALTAEADELWYAWKSELRVIAPDGPREAIEGSILEVQWGCHHEPKCVDYATHRAKNVETISKSIDVARAFRGGRSVLTLEGQAPVVTPASAGSDDVVGGAMLAVLETERKAGGESS